MNEAPTSNQIPVNQLFVSLVNEAIEFCNSHRSFADANVDRQVGTSQTVLDWIQLGD